MDGGGGGGGEGDRFHRNEAISAVSEDAFLGEEEEEDDDYEDLYNDVNVGEGFYQSLNKTNSDDVVGKDDHDVALASQNEEINNISSDCNNNDNIRNNGNAETKIESSPAVPRNPAGESSDSARVSAHQTGQRGAVGALRVELGPGSGKFNENEGQSGGKTIDNGSSINTGVINANNNNNNININSNSVSVLENTGQRMYGGGGGVVGSVGPNENMVRSVNGGNAVGNAGVGGGGGNGTILFVGDLHWWTTDVELEAELYKYGTVKEVKFFDEKASGKSKGYCQLEFYDPSAAAACKEGMNGHVFNGRPCVVSFASPYTVKRMGEAQVNRSHQTTQAAGAQVRRGNNDGGAGKTGGAGGGASAGGGPSGTISTGGNYQGGDGNRGFGRGNWGRGNAQGMANRGPVGPMRNRTGGGGGMGGRGIMGNGFGQGIGATPPLLHPNSMMGQGFDPAFGAPMGRMGGYGGFPGAPTPPFSGILSSFPPVAGMGLPGVAPHVNPAFFVRGMPMNGMGMMPAGGDGPNMGMWSDPNMGGWVGEEHGGGRAGESSYGEEAASDHQYGEASHDRGGWKNSMKEKDRASEKDWSGSSDMRYRDDRETGYDRDVRREKDMGGPDHSRQERRQRDDRDSGRERERERERDRERSRDRDCERERDHVRDRDRDRYGEDRDRYSDHHRYRDREAEHGDDWDQGRSSKTQSKSRLPHEEDRRSRSRDADYGKR